MSYGPPVGINFVHDEAPITAGAEVDVARAAVATKISMEAHFVVAILKLLFHIVCSLLFFEPKRLSGMVQSTLRTVKAPRSIPHKCCPHVDLVQSIGGHSAASYTRRSTTDRRILHKAIVKGSSRPIARISLDTDALPRGPERYNALRYCS